MNNDYEYNGSNEVYPSYTEVNNFKTNNINIKPPNKKRKWPIILLVLLLIIVGVLIYLTFFTDKLDFMKSDDNYSEFDPNKGKIDSNSNETVKSNKPSNKPSNSNKVSNSNSNINKVVESISIIPKTPSVLVGSNITLKANITPSDAKDKTIIWRSSDAKIATVNSKGVVTGVKAGTATITATSKNGKKASVKVVVTTKKIPVTGIKIQSDNLKLEYQKTAQLTATISPSNATNKNIVWSSSNSDIVSVDQNGLIVGKNTSSATITATTKDGGYKDSIVVTVELPAVKSISISGPMEVCYGSAANYSARTNPSLAKDNTIYWSSSDTSVATVNGSGYVRGLKLGKTTITAYTKNGTKVKKPISVKRCSADYSLILTQTFGYYYNGCYGASLYFKGEKITDWDSFEYNGYKLIRTQPICPTSYNIDKSKTSATIIFEDGVKLYNVKITYK